MNVFRLKEGLDILRSWQSRILSLVQQYSLGIIATKTI